MAHTDGRFSDVGLQPLEIKATANTEEEFRIKLYNPIHAIYDPTKVLGPPQPTHMRLEYDSFVSADLDIEENWFLLHNCLRGVTGWIEGETVNIVWLLETSTSSSKLILGLSPMIVHELLA